MRKLESKPMELSRSHQKAYEGAICFALVRGILFFFFVCDGSVLAIRRYGCEVGQKCW